MVETVPVEAAVRPPTEAAVRALVPFRAGRAGAHGPSVGEAIGPPVPVAIAVGPFEVAPTDAAVGAIAPGGPPVETTPRVGAPTPGGVGRAPLLREVGEAAPAPGVKASILPTPLQGEGPQEGAGQPSAAHAWRLGQALHQTQVARKAAAKARVARPVAGAAVPTAPAGRPSVHLETSLFLLFFSLVTLEVAGGARGALPRVGPGSRHAVLRTDGGEACACAVPPPVARIEAPCAALQGPGERGPFLSPLAGRVAGAVADARASHPTVVAPSFGEAPRRAVAHLECRHLGARDRRGRAGEVGVDPTWDAPLAARLQPAALRSAVLAAPGAPLGAVSARGVAIPGREPPPCR